MKTTFCFNIKTTFRFYLKTFFYPHLDAPLVYLKATLCSNPVLLCSTWRQPFILPEGHLLFYLNATFFSTWRLPFVLPEGYFLFYLKATFCSTGRPPFCSTWKPPFVLPEGNLLFYLKATFVLAEDHLFSTWRPLFVQQEWGDWTPSHWSRSPYPPPWLNSS